MVCVNYCVLWSANSVSIHLAKNSYTSQKQFQASVVLFENVFQNTRKIHVEYFEDHDFSVR